MIDRPLQTQYFWGLLLWYRIHIFCLTTFLILHFSLFNFCNTNIISKELVWDLIAFHEPATACKFTRKTSIFSFFISGLYIDILTLHIPKSTGAFYPKKYIQYSRGGFFSDSFVLYNVYIWFSNNFHFLKPYIRMPYELNKLNCPIFYKVLNKILKRTKQS